MEPIPLPSSPQLVTSIISQLSTYISPVLNCADSSSAGTNALRNNPLSTLPALTLAKIRPLLLTLHCFFPSDLLLALDILDRRLVKRYIIRCDVPPNVRGDEAHCGCHLENHISSRDGIYFVHSSSSSLTSTATTANSAPPRGRAPAQTVYEVHIHSWNCSCPAFALAAFRDLDSLEGVDRNDQRAAVHVDNRRGEQEPTKEPREWRFGGALTTEHSGTPICKHLLACILGSQCPELFGGGVEEVDVDASELAGWTSGWYD